MFWAEQPYPPSWALEQVLAKESVPLGWCEGHENENYVWLNLVKLPSTAFSKLSSKTADQSIPPSVFSEDIQALSLCEPAIHEVLWLAWHWNNKFVLLAMEYSSAKIVIFKHIAVKYPTLPILKDQRIHLPLGHVRRSKKLTRAETKMAAVICSLDLVDGQPKILPWSKITSVHISTYQY